MYCSNIIGQTITDFESDFNILAKNGFPTEQIEPLLEKYETLIHHSDQNAISYNQNSSVPTHPLQILLHNENYLNSINTLLTDSLESKKNLGLILVGGSFDRERIPIVENICKTSNYQNILAATVLGTLNTPDAMPIVKTLVAMQNNETATQYLLTFFLALDTQTLDKFFLDSVASKSTYMGFLAIKAASKGPIYEQKEVKLREVVRSNSPAIGWAISLLADAGIGDLHTLVSGFLNDENLRGVSLRALANSASVNDINALDSLISSGPAGKDLLRALLNSRRTQAHLKWIDILREAKIDKSYYPFINHSKLKENNEIYLQMCALIMNNLTKQSYFPLFNYFENRLDDRSTSFLLSCLIQPIHMSQSTAIIQVMADRNKVMIAKAIPELMAKANNQKPLLVDLLLLYKDYRYTSIVAVWLNEPGLELAYQKRYRQYLNEAEDVKLNQK